MKRKNPPNKAPLFKLLGDINGSGSGPNGEQTQEQMMLDSIGCTANVILIDKMQKIYAANAGDSRCVLGRGGKAFPLSFSSSSSTLRKLYLRACSQLLDL